MLSSPGFALQGFFNDQTVAGLAALSIGSIVATSNLVLTAAQVSALSPYSVIAIAGHSVTFTNSDGSRSVYGYGANGVVTRVVDYAADGSIVDIANYNIVGQPYTFDYIYYGANNKPASAYYSNGMNATWSYNADSSLHDIAWGNVAGAAYTYYDVVYGGDGKAVSAVYSNGMSAAWTYNSDGSVHDIDYSGIIGAAFVSYRVSYMAGKALRADYSNGMSAVWTYNSDGSVHDINYAGVAGAAYMQYDILYGANHKPMSATYSNGMIATWTYNDAGQIQDVNYTGVTGAAYTQYDVSYGANGRPETAVYSNGLTGAWSYYAQGPVLSLTLAGFQGGSYSSYEDVYSLVGARDAHATDNVNGTGALTLFASGETVVVGPTRLAMIVENDEADLAPHNVETLTKSGTLDDAFFFTSAGPGDTAWTDTLRGARLSGLATDAFTFAASAFGATNASDAWTNLLAGTKFTPTEATITDASGDRLILAGVASASLTAAQSSFLFV